MYQDMTELSSQTSIKIRQIWNSSFRCGQIATKLCIPSKVWGMMECQHELDWTICSSSLYSWSQMSPSPWTHIMKMSKYPLVSLSLQTLCSVRILFPHVVDWRWKEESPVTITHCRLATTNPQPRASLIAQLNTAIPSNSRNSIFHLPRWWKCSSKENISQNHPAESGRVGFSMRVLLHRPHTSVSRSHHIKSLLLWKGK